MIFATFLIISSSNLFVAYKTEHRRPEIDLVPLCLERNVVLLPYGVLAGGFLSDKWLGVADPGKMCILPSPPKKYMKIMRMLCLKSTSHKLTNVS